MSQVSITVLDASSGQARPEIPLAKTEVPESAIAFSRDGRWLGWTQNSEQVALLDFEHPSDPPVVVDVGPNIGFALPESGSTIVTVTDHPLRSEVLTRVTDKQWTHEPFDLTGCTSPQSISPGTRLLSATWKGRRCTYRFGRVGVLDRRNLDRDTWDIIWSAGGGASAELLYSGEFIVSGADNAEELENHVRAEHKIEDRSDKTLLISVSESGRRFAFIDADKHKLVKIFSLGGHKPFLSGFDPNGFAVAPVGAWFAATSVGPGAASGVRGFARRRARFTDCRLRCRDRSAAIPAPGRRRPGDGRDR